MYMIWASHCLYLRLHYHLKNWGTIGRVICPFIFDFLNLKTACETWLCGRRWALPWCILGSPPCLGSCIIQWSLHSLWLLRDHNDLLLIHTGRSGCLRANSVPWFVVVASPNILHIPHPVICALRGPSIPTERAPSIPTEMALGSCYIHKYMSLFSCVTKFGEKQKIL